MEKKTIAIIFLSITAIVLCCFLFLKPGGNAELDLYKKNYEKDRVQRMAQYAADSLVLAKLVVKEKAREDSIQAHWNNESVNQQKIVKYYEKALSQSRV